MSARPAPQPDNSTAAARVSVADLPLRMLAEQTGTMSAMLLGGLRSLLPLRKTGVTGETIRQTVRSPSAELLQAYAAWSGAGDRYRNTLPPHLVCAKITLPLVSQLTAQSPYPLLGVLNQGLRLRLHAPLPAGEDIQLAGTLLDASDDGYRARIHSQVTVGTASTPQAMTIDAMAAVVLKKRPEKDAAREPDAADFETVATWQAAANEGQTFFWLTGDFNPIHTWPAFAKRTPFRGCIMHGYGAFAQVYEGLVRHGLRLAEIDVRFVRPLPLPSAALLIQCARNTDAQGRRAIRLIDTDNTLYQVGYCIEVAKG